METNDPSTYSRHYVAESGVAYFEQKLNHQLELGRLFQTRYFSPYVDREHTILDFGCADGLFLRTLAAKEKIGVEINPYAREKCRLASQAGKVPIELYAKLSEVHDARADVVISNHCLEHVPCPFTALTEIRRILKIGGRLVLVVPFDDWRSRHHRKWTPNDSDLHLYTWTPMNIGNLLQEANFRVENVKLCSTAWSPKFFWVKRVLGNKMFLAACRLNAILKSRREIFCVARKK